MNRHLLNIGLNMIRMFILPIAVFALSFVVIQSAGKELWGNFVSHYLLINISAMLVLFGSKEPLIRSFSATPNNIGSLFYQSLYTRGVILLPLLPILGFFSSNFYEWGLISLAIFGLYLYQSAETLVIYHRRFVIQILAEILALISTIGWILSRPTLHIEDVLFAFTLGVWLKTILILITVFPKIQILRPNFNHFSIIAPFFIIGLSGLLQSRIDQYIIAGYCEDLVIGTYQPLLSVFILIQSLSAVILVPYNKHIYRVGLSVFTKIHRSIALLGILIVTTLAFVAYLLLPLLLKIELPPYYFIVGALFAYPSFIYAPIIYMYYRVHKEREVTWVSYIGAAINLSLTFYFVIEGNPLHAIIGSAIGQWIILAWYSYRKKIIFQAVYQTSSSKT